MSPPVPDSVFTHFPASLASVMTKGLFNLTSKVQQRSKVNLKFVYRKPPATWLLDPFDEWEGRGGI